MAVQDAPPAAVVVVGLGETGDGAAASRIANQLRAAGWTAVLDVRERTPNAALRNARTLRAAIYAEPRDGGAAIRWVPLNGDEERHIPIDDLPARIGSNGREIANGK
jgi:hypothetical protein